MKDLIEQSRSVLLGSNQLNEKLFRLQGTVNSIISKALSEFMKNNKKVKSKDEFVSAWTNKKNLTAFNKTIADGVTKKISKGDIAYITTNASSVDWSFKDGGSKNGSVTVSGDVYVNIGINDDVDASKLERKVKGSLNKAVQTSDSILNKFDGSIKQNIELDDNLVQYLIDTK